MNNYRSALPALLAMTACFCAQAGIPEIAPRVPYRSAIAVDAGTGNVLFDDQSTTSAHPASCTKLMTLLLVLEDIRAKRYSLSDTAEASVYAARFGGSSFGIKAGTVLTIDDLIYALVVKSANDGALVLAEFAVSRAEANRPPETTTPPTNAPNPLTESKRRVRAFIDRMNRRAQELGMKDTRFVSPNGMTPYLGQAYPGYDVSTAADLAKLARRLVTLPEAFAYTSCAAHAITVGDRKIELVAHNYFLPGTHDPKQYATPLPECDGLKTGFTDSAGASIVLTAQRKGRRVVAVVLGSDSRKARETAAGRILRAALDAIQ